MKTMDYSNVIGKGSFSTAYLQSDNKTVVLKSTDYIKECMSLGWFPNTIYFPKIERLEHGVYKMKHYPKVKSLVNCLKIKQYLIYKQLRNLNIKHNTRDCDLLDAWRDVFKSINNKTVRSALIQGIEACSNYGTDICFEISPRNVAVSPSGNLILLDCFFIKSQLKKQRT
tara:strand:+ start:404 stop:913 length:510 start_codon:yes stop_codon:yes gene_type:complete